MAHQNKHFKAHALSKNDIIYLLRDNIRIFTISSLIAFGLLFSLIICSKPSYSSTTQLFVSYNTSEDEAPNYYSVNSYVSSQIKSYLDLATSELVLRPVIDELHLSISPRELANSISILIPTNTTFINITVNDEDANQSANIANAVATSLKKTIEKSLYSKTNAESIRLTTVQTALPPAKPYAPDYALTVAASIIIGLTAGIIVTILRSRSMKYVSNPDSVKKYTDADIIGNLSTSNIPSSKHENKSKEESSDPVDYFHNISTTLSYLQPSSNSACRLIAVTSAEVTVDIASLSFSIANSIAETNTRVLFIDADLHAATPNSGAQDHGIGLTHVLAGKATVAQAVHTYSSNLHILEHGFITTNAPALLSSPAMNVLLDNAMHHYDYVLVNTAPLNKTNDSIRFACLGGSLVMICQQNVTTKASLTYISEEVKKAGIYNNYIIYVF